MGIRDNNIDWLRKSLMLYNYNSGGLAETATTAFHRSSLTAGVTQESITTSGVEAMTITDGEFMSYGIKVPHDLDPGFPIGFRVHWTADHDGTGSLTASWIMLQKFIARGAAIAVAATVLDTIIPLLSPYQDTSGDVTVVTDFLYQVSGRGILDSCGLTRKQIEEAAMFIGKLELDAAIEETSIRLIALELDYVPWKTQGQGNNYSRPRLHTGVE